MNAPTGKETKQWKMLIEKLDQEKNKWRISSFDIVAKKSNQETQIITSAKHPYKDAL
jgi:hypothetical protein